MFSARDHLKEKLDALNAKVTNDLDFDFSTVAKKIDTFDEFQEHIVDGFNSERKLFYRGERINSPKRRLLPTMLRKPEEILRYSDLGIVHIDSDFLVNYYNSLGSFATVFKNTMGQFDKEHLYELCAFAQHYCEFSPLIDFTKSIYPALSFAIKNRTVFDEDIILFVLEINDVRDYTDDIHRADEWLKSINVYFSCFDEFDIRNAVKEITSNKQLDMTAEFKKHMQRISTKPVPTAKLIDVPTNTRMKFQQGVFLFLNNFQLYNKSYLTKQIREDFTITKYIISKDICPAIKEYINKNAPWYAYEYLTDIQSAFKIAVEE